jgi:hypothetical protein
MSVEVAAELWNELRRYVNVVDRGEAAETVVSVLIDTDHSADEIRTAFKGDSDIKRALTSYLSDADVDEEEGDDYESDWED